MSAGNFGGGGLNFDFKAKMPTKNRNYHSPHKHYRPIKILVELFLVKVTA